MEKHSVILASESFLSIESNYLKVAFDNVMSAKSYRELPNYIDSNGKTQIWKYDDLFADFKEHALSLKKLILDSFEAKKIILIDTELFD